MNRMLQSILHYVKSLVLVELLKGLATTGRHLFTKKVTVQYPDEKTPQSPRFRGLHALRRYANGEDSEWRATTFTIRLPLGYSQKTHLQSPVAPPSKGASGFCKAYRVTGNFY
jgi:hypothetical protein